jgi:hypothetical protein
MAWRREPEQSHEVAFAVFRADVDSDALPFVDDQYAALRTAGRHLRARRCTGRDHLERARRRLGLDRRAGRNNFPFGMSATVNSVDAQLHDGMFSAVVPASNDIRFVARDAVGNTATASLTPPAHRRAPSRPRSAPQISPTNGSIARGSSAGPPGVAAARVRTARRSVS